MPELKLQTVVFSAWLIDVFYSIVKFTLYSLQLYYSLISIFIHQSQASSQTEAVKV